MADSQSGMQRIKQQLSNWNEEDRVPSGVLVDHHRDSTPILEFFRVNAAIREALKPRVDLPSGGYIIIEPTEALTVIDVNSGSFTRSATARETVLWTNCEAAIEIARQLRLRNIAGVIVVDFIDMESFRDKKHVLEQFERALKADKARPQISQLSELGLVELTRKRQGQNIYELFGRPCSTCGGLGHVAQLPGEQPEALSLERSPASHRSSRSGRGSRGSSSVTSPEPAYQNLQALDLLNHPDYQSGEKSNGKGSSRRRRRRGGSNGDAPPSRSSRNGSSRDNGREPVARETKPAEIRAAVEAPPEPQEETTSSKKRSRSRSRKPETTPEKIVVEMTPDQQRVYAEMGISPLVLSQKTPDDPKNTAITVVLPGEAPALEAEADPAPAPAEDVSSTNGAEPSESSRPEKPKLVKKSEAATAPPDKSADKSADKKVEKEPEAAVEKEPVAATPRRRRRRRSSAS